MTWFYLNIILIISLFILSNCKSILLLSKASGISCPYSASWLAHISLIKITNLNINIKMEEASFLIERKVKDIYQFIDNDLYYVNHLSGYEHEIKKYESFNISEEKLQILSNIAVKEECLLKLRKENNDNGDNVNNIYNTIAIIPFYSGRPPQVTADLKVESIGQGNSLVNSTIKALQCLITTCSTLQYFQSAIIAVGTPHDKILIEKTIQNHFYNKHHSKTINIKVIEFDANPPATLPFLLLIWIQTCIKYHECIISHNSSFNNSNFNNDTDTNTNTNNQKCNKINIDIDIEINELDEICLVYNSIIQEITNVSHIYYTEADQILRLKNKHILQEILHVSNQTSMIMGYRKQKDPKSSPLEYMSSLYPTRSNCGKSGYYLDLQTHQIYAPITSMIHSNNSLTNENNQNHQKQNKLTLQMKHRNAIMYKKQQKDAILQMKKSFQNKNNLH